MVKGGYDVGFYDICLNYGVVWVEGCVWDNDI